MWKSLVLVASLRLSKGQVVNAREDVQETGSAQGRGVQAVCMQAWERWFQEEREERMKPEVVLRKVGFTLKSMDFFLGFSSFCLDLSFLKGICCHSVARLNEF